MIDSDEARLQGIAEHLDEWGETGFEDTVWLISIVRAQALEIERLKLEKSLYVRAW